MSKRQYIPALRGRFGDWAYYATLMTVECIAQRIGYARDIHQSASLSELIQRELKGGRAKEIGEYLQRNEDRFFNSLVVAIYGGSPGWHELEVRIQGDEIRHEDLDDTALHSIGYLSLTDEEKIFALDGQHRLAGIQQALSKEPNLGEEELSVVFVAHHNTPEGMRRTRKLFTTLNKQARPVKKSEIIALDESDVMAIASRHLVESHKYFNNGQIDVMRKQANLAPNDFQHFTTIINLYNVLGVVFPYIRERMDKDRSYELRLYRPADEVLERYLQFAEKYFEDLANTFSELKRYFSADDGPSILREMRTDDGGHVLFRPIGLSVFTDVIKELRSSYSYDDSIEKISKLPVSLSEPPFADTLWNTHTKTMNSRQAAATVCRDVLLYMLGRGRRLEELKKRYARVLEVAEEDVELPAKVL